jgi:ketosteroid isomerase-like protein
MFGSMRHVKAAIVALALIAPGAAAQSHASDVRAIRTLMENYRLAANAKDLPSIMRCYTTAPELVVFDVSNAPFRGAAEVQRDWSEFFGAMRTIQLDFRDIAIEVAADKSTAYALFIERASLVIASDGQAIVNDKLRTTQIYRKVRGRWLIVHEHKSKSLTDK